MCLDILIRGCFINLTFMNYKRFYLILGSDICIEIVGVHYTSVVIKTAKPIYY